MKTLTLILLALLLSLAGLAQTKRDTAKRDTSHRVYATAAYIVVQKSDFDKLAAIIPPPGTPMTDAMILRLQIEWAAILRKEAQSGK